MLPTPMQPMRRRSLGACAQTGFGAQATGIAVAAAANAEALKKSRREKLLMFRLLSED
jgi:hypothetical protein